MDAGIEGCPIATCSEPLCLHVLAETSEAPRAGDQAKKGKRKGRNKQETPAYVEPSTHVEEVKTPLDLAKVGASDT